MSITKLHNDLKSKKISSVELTQDCLAKIKKANDNLNAFITICEDQALAQAKIADNNIVKGNITPLTGIPIAQKDIFCTKGIQTTCGSKMLNNFIAPYNATVIEKFNSAGAILIGKTNMDEFAMGSSNENSFYGPVKNPVNNDLIPGGSSGGSAAAVAAGLVPGATGTDTGGSIRQPAALCGLVGLKPTYGRVSRFGMIAFASSLDQGGPIATTVEDCALMLNVMAGYDSRDSTCANIGAPDFGAHLHDDIKGIKIGLPREFFNKDLDPKIGDKIMSTIKEYEKRGAIIKEISLPHNHLSIAAYYIIAPCEASSNLSRYDGVRFGHRCENPKDLLDLYKRTRDEGFGIEVKRRIMMGTFALSSGYYDAYYLKAQKIRHLIRDDFIKAFTKVDVIMGPTSPTTAFKIGEKVNDPVSMYLSDIYTLCVNLAGLPAISIPAGNIDGLPIGLQIIGKAFDETTILKVANINKN